MVSISRVESLNELSVRELKKTGSARIVPRTELKDILRPGHDGSTLPADLSATKYFQISSMMQTGEINSSPSDQHYQRHLSRMSALLSNAAGMGLDIGCGDPTIGAAIFPNECDYVGVEPFATGSSQVAIVGVSEDLPFIDNSFDFAVFNTSLDHVLDYLTAIREAHRIIRPGGELFISTLIWLARDTLISDEVHFHHFRYYEIFGALVHCGFRIEDVAEYPYKADNHRVGCYLRASK